jgi:hypothetical protein
MPRQRAGKQWSRWRYGRAVRAIGSQYRAGEMAAKPAAAAISRALRTYLRESTGVPVDYMPAGAIAVSELASTAALFDLLADAQFNPDSIVDVGALSDSAADLIRTWG